MLGFLFRTLTADRTRGAELFKAATKIAREPHWFVEGEAPDTLDGRFAVLTTVLALIFVRLEREGPAGDPASVALTERFVEVMESEHRELGLGDPSLGKKVRQLVGSLSGRTDKWREAVLGAREWPQAARDSLYKDPPSTAALAHSAAALKAFWENLQKTDISAVAEGRLA
jgi:cytochrome b pre-mRNA-processing protein 3